MREPTRDFEDGRFVFSYEIKRNPINMDWWCQNTLKQKQLPSRIKLEETGLIKQMNEFKDD